MPTYYIDLTNGSDSRTGLKIGPSTIDSTADTTHFVDDLLTGADDYINGSYFYNVTRGIGSLIADFVALTDTVTLASAIAGMTAGDTYYILDAWLTLGKYTASARTAGDIAYVRAGTTQTVGAADITFTTNGTQAAIISLIGCDASVNDPWVDASNTVPIIDFNSGNYNMVASKNYWLIKRLTASGSADGGGAIALTGIGSQISYCNMINNTQVGLSGSGGGIGFIDNCVFNNNTNYNINIPSPSIYYISNCTFDGTTTHGLRVVLGAITYVSDTTFGSTTPHTTTDITTDSGGQVYCRNCTFNKSTLVVVGAYTSIYSEDDDGVFGNQVDYYLQGTITKSATARDGGASSSAQMMPSASCGAIFPLCLNNIQSSVAPDFAIYNTSTSPVNVDIYIRADSAWATPPTAAQLYTEASYLNSAASAARSTAVSTQTINEDGTTWTAFRTTFTPARAGWIYMKVYLKLYASGEGILVDILPVVS